MTDTWHVYIASCADGTLYTGIAKDLEARIKLHNEGGGAKYTRGRRPIEVTYSEQAPDQGQALKRERAIKRLSRPEKLRLIAQAQGEASIDK